MFELVRGCPPLDVNSVYVYLLLAEHFSDTCIVFEDEEGLSGLVTAYRPPARPDVLFVWQVAVAPRARGQRLGLQMLHALLGRSGLQTIQSIETTVGADNGPSRRMFGTLARSLQAPIAEAPLFGADLFGAEGHEAEPLLRIGPFETSAIFMADDKHKGDTHGLKNL